MDNHDEQDASYQTYGLPPLFALDDAIEAADMQGVQKNLRRSVEAYSMFYYGCSGSFADPRRIASVYTISHIQNCVKAKAARSQAAWAVSAGPSSSGSAAALGVSSGQPLRST